MRYTEQDSSFKFETFYDYVRGAVILTLIGPLRLVKEISTKVIYLNKTAIKRVLMTACLLEFCIFILQCVINAAIFHNELGLLIGKVPIIVHLMALIVLALLYFGYTTYDFIIYKQLDKFLPIVAGVNITQSEVKEEEEEQSSELQFDNFQDLDKVLQEQTDKLNDVQEDMSDLTDVSLTELDTDFFDSMEDVSVEPPKYDIPAEVVDLVNPELYESEDIFKFQNEVEETFANMTEEEVKYTGDLTENEKEEIKKNMDNSREPSKYISEDNLTLFFSKIGVDNFGTIDDLSNWCTPKTFPLVS